MSENVTCREAIASKNYGQASLECFDIQTKGEKTNLSRQKWTVKDKLESHLKLTISVVFGQNRPKEQKLLTNPKSKSKVQVQV